MSQAPTASGWVCTENHLCACLHCLRKATSAHAHRRRRQRRCQARAGRACCALTAASDMTRCRLTRGAGRSPAASASLSPPSPASGKSGALPAYSAASRCFRRASTSRKRASSWGCAIPSSCSRRSSQCERSPGVAVWEQPDASGRLSARGSRAPSRLRRTSRRSRRRRPPGARRPRGASPAGGAAPRAACCAARAGGAVRPQTRESAGDERALRFHMPGSGPAPPGGQHTCC